MSQEPKRQEGSEGIQTPDFGSARTGVSEEPKREDGSEGIQTPESGSVRRGREPGAKEKERVKGSKLQSLDLPEEGVPKRA